MAVVLRRRCDRNVKAVPRGAREFPDALIHGAAGRGRESMLDLTVPGAVAAPDRGGMA
jgi:hypothetical protein